jgi:hypothetical protein
VQKACLSSGGCVILKGMDKIRIPDGYKPELHEIEVAKILVGRFDCEIEFLRPSNSYKVSTPDIEMRGQLWEIKSPLGCAKHTIQEQFKRSSKQSCNIIIDGQRSKRSDEDLVKDIQKEIKLHKTKRRVLFITKDKKVLDMGKRG